MGSGIARTNQGKHKDMHSDPMYCIIAQNFDSPGLSTQKVKCKNNKTRNGHTGSLMNLGWHSLHLQRTEVGKNVCQDVTDLSDDAENAVSRYMITEDPCRIW
jgi:hypothetical protein